MVSRQGGADNSADPGRDVEEQPSALADPASSAKRRRRWPRVLAVIGLVMAMIAVASMAGFWYLAQRLESNVATIEGFEASDPVASYEPVNFLIMGTDNRGGGNSDPNQAAEIVGERSDTALLVHVSADRDSALVVSIPRDTLLQLPKCASVSGEWEVTDRFNAAFTFGGPTCTVEAVERLTGVDINHAVVVDFLGFKGVVDAIGGVDVCLEEATYDADSGLDLPAGWSTVTGDQALAFVRARKALGDGSDIDRIARQQQFISSAIRQVTDAELVFKPVTLYRILDAVTGSLTVDEGIDDLDEMVGMARSLSGLRPENVKFVTMPFVYSPDGRDVLVNEPIADEIWAAIEQDQPWPKPADPSLAALTVAPSSISVLVTNGSGVDNAATDAAADLQLVGFGVAGLQVADTTTFEETVVVHHPSDAEAARTLQRAVPGSVLQSRADAPVGQVELIVGVAYDGAQAVDVPRQPEGTQADPLPTSAETSVCAK